MVVWLGSLLMPKDSAITVRLIPTLSLVIHLGINLVRSTYRKLTLLLSSLVNWVWSSSSCYNFNGARKPSAKCSQPAFFRASDTSTFCSPFLIAIVCDMADGSALRINSLCSWFTIKPLEPKTLEVPSASPTADHPVLFKRKEAHSASAMPASSELSTKIPSPAKN